MGGEGEGENNWEIRTDIYVLHCVGPDGSQEAAV